MAYSYEVPIVLADGGRVDADIHGHHIATDQPCAKGGEDSAPSPFDLFLASIGTCAATTIKEFCRRREIPMADIKVMQRVVFDDEGDLAEVELKVELPPSFPQKYADALQRVVAQCPVERAIRVMPTFIVTHHIAAAS